MPFEKGNTINLGRKHSEETRKKWSEMRQGIKHSRWGAGFKKGNKPWNSHASVYLNAYFAALVDGEGSIFITSNGARKGYNTDGRYKKICVAICMRADKAQPLYIGQKIWGGSLNIRKPRKSNHNEALDWRLWTDAADKFLKSIRPYILIKKKQLDIATRYRSLQTRKRKNVYRAIISDEELAYRKTLETELKLLNS